MSLISTSDVLSSLVCTSDAHFVPREDAARAAREAELRAEAAREEQRRQEALPTLATQHGSMIAGEDAFVRHASLITAGLEMPLTR